MLTPNNTNGIADDTIAGYEQFLASHPYYAPAQVRLLQKYTENGQPGFARQAALVSLFFKNEKWLRWQLSHSDALREVLSVNIAERIEMPPPTPEITEEDEVAFEPLHTVDYFASQGIRLAEETQPQDKLGTQLKSFTEWLKSMKKAHNGNPSSESEQSDKSIQHIAETSNTTKVVLTEAMAEVLVKQGKKEQAMEIYNKLSLNNPSQSAYFAAKITRLKQV